MHGFSGKEFTASSTMPYGLDLDSLNYDLVSDYFLGDIAFLSCYFTDRKDVEDYCRFNLYQNGNSINRIYHLYQDRYTDGEQIVIDGFESHVNLDDIVTFELLTIEKSIHEYFSLLNSKLTDINDDASMTFLPVTLYNPSSNISNGGLGYFSAHAKRSYTFLVK